MLNSANAKVDKKCKNVKIDLYENWLFGSFNLKVNAFGWKTGSETQTHPLFSSKRILALLNEADKGIDVTWIAYGNHSILCSKE